MNEIAIHREHPFGLARAREIATHWAEDMEEQYGMHCTLASGEHQDEVSFSRRGVSGRLIVAADHFDLHVRLGFLLAGFSKAIEAQVHRNFDILLAEEARRSAPPD